MRWCRSGNLWDLLLPQTKLNLNLLRQATLDPSSSAWVYFHGPFNYDATPIGPLGCNIITHKKFGTINSWDFCGTSGLNVGVALVLLECYTDIQTGCTTEVPLVYCPELLVGDDVTT